MKYLLLVILCCAGSCRNVNDSDDDPIDIWINYDRLTPLISECEELGWDDHVEAFEAAYVFMDFEVYEENVETAGTEIWTHKECTVVFDYVRHVDGGELTYFFMDAEVWCGDDRDDFCEMVYNYGS